MNYLQYIRSVHNENTQLSKARFLVSGTDTLVKDTVCKNIVISACSNRKTLFLLDNTQNGDIAAISAGYYNIVNILNGDINLCSDLLDVKSLIGISRLRGLLSDHGFDSVRSMKVVAYLNFVMETEKRLGNNLPLNINVLEQYGSTILIEWKLNQLLDTGKIDENTYNYLLGRYAEVSEAAADFETFLVLFSPFLGSRHPAEDTAVYIPISKFAADRPMQNMMCKLLISYIQQNPDNSAVLIIDDGNGERSFIADVVKNIPADAAVHMLSDDAFSLDEADRNVILNSFPIKIYTRHENMISCKIIEEYCGQIDVVKRASTVTVDRRFRANSAWDMLMGTNRTDTEITNAPVKEYRYSKEMLNSLMAGTGIIDYGGNKVLFTF